MSHMLEIPDALYAALEATAKVSGLSPVDWIAAHLPQLQRERLEVEPQAASPAKLADLFAGRIGRIRSNGRQRLSEECGAQFTDYLEQKRQAGHL